MDHWLFETEDGFALASEAVNRVCTEAPQINGELDLSTEAGRAAKALLDAEGERLAAKLKRTHARYIIG